MNADQQLIARAKFLAEQDITLEAGKAVLMQEGKDLVKSIGFMPAVDAVTEAIAVFESHHWAASARIMRERNPIKGFRIYKM